MSTKTKLINPRLPNSTEALLRVSAERAITDPLIETSSNGSAGHRYQYLCSILELRGVDLRAFYSVRQVAQIIDKSDRAIRNWITQGIVTYSRWPTGDVYFTSDQVEKIFKDGEQGRVDYR